jgi:cytochrome c-type biogenesis protein CcmH/NrfG
VLHSRGSRVRALLWTVAAVSLLVPALSVYEAIGMSRDPAPEHIAEAQRHLRWIGRESVARHVEVGRKSELADRAGAAIEHYRRSVELFPNAAGWEGLGRIYARQQQLALALDAYDHAVALQPESPRLLFRRAQIGFALAQNGTLPDPDLREAIGVLRRVLALQPAHAPASLMLAQLLADTGRSEEARQILERAIERAGDARSPQMRQQLAALQRDGS